MTLFPDLSFWFYLIIFFLVSFIAFFLPGDVLLSRVKLHIIPRITLSVCLGMVLWGWQGYIFGYLHIRWVSYLYVFIFFALWILLNKKTSFSMSFPSFKKIDVVILFLIILGSIIHLSYIWFAGIHHVGGVYFYAYSLPDNLFYMDLTNEVIKNVPPFEPGFAKIPIQNYHYWSSLVMAELIRVFHLPFIPTVSQFFPILLSFLLAGTLASFCQLIKISKYYFVWLIFFAYFGGDFVTYIQFFHGRGMDFTQQSMEDGAKLFANPPRVFAVILFFAGMSYLYLWIKSKIKLVGVFTAIILGSIIGFKVYVGFFALIGLLCLSFYFLIKKNYQIGLFTVLAIVLSFIIYLPVNGGAGGFIYTGFWIARDFIVLSSLGLSQLELARQIYSAHDNWFHALIFDLGFLMLFYVGTFGTKLLGVFQNKQSLRLFPKEIHIFLIPAFFASITLGTFFIQKSGGANAFNFLVNVFIIASFYAALACFYWLQKVPNFLKVFLILVIILFTVPRSVYQLIHNIDTRNNQNGVIIDANAANVYLFLESQKDGTIILPENVSYLSFLSGKAAFLYNDSILESHGINIATRKKIRDIVFHSNNRRLVQEQLKKNNIDYLYLPNITIPSNADNYFGKTIYQNRNMRIIKIFQNKL